MSHIHFSQKALERRALANWRGMAEPAKPSLASKVWSTVMYGSVVVGVSVAAFYVTPSHAASQTNTSSIIYLGEKAKFDTRVNERKAANQMEIDDNRLVNSLKLEDAKSLHARQLEEDKAYYKKLEWQRKTGK
jgi:hypothetical protein